MRIPGMKKVHPNMVEATEERVANSEVVLTVWKKSLLFNCNGFTVFDGKGDLVFRVDNYMTGCGSQGEILLMNSNGNPLLTIRRKRLSLGDNWLVYDGESLTNPRFSACRKHNILNTTTRCTLAHVGPVNSSNSHAYEIEGSYAQRCCSIYECSNDQKRRKLVAEIKQKEAVGGVAFGCDVFRLVVWPDFIDTSLAMAIVILLDQMFASSRLFSS